MLLWSFRVYLSAKGESEIEKWYDSLDPKAKVKIDHRLDYLERMPIENWIMPHFEKLSGEVATGIGEIRAKMTGQQIRLLGFFGPQQREFTIALKAIKYSKNGKTIWKPKEAVAIAKNRRRECESDRRRSHEWLR